MTATETATAVTEITIVATGNPIHSVCVFQSDRAEVRRIFPVELQPGRNDVVIEQLPNCLDKDSIRVEGLGNASVVDVVYEPPSSDKPDLYAKDDKLREIEKQLAGLRQRRTILEQQKALLETYGGSLDAEHSGPDKVLEFLGIYKEKRQKLYKDLADVKEKEEEAEREKKLRQKEVDGADVAKTRATSVTIVMNTEKSGKAELSLWYMVTGASWKPTYDVRATIAKNSKETSSVALKYRADISQQTGEDWNEVELRLSTAAAQLDTNIPTLGPQKIGPMESVSYGGGMEKSARSSSTFARMKSYKRQSSSLAAMEAMDGPIVHVRATAQESVTTSTFLIPGKSTIPSDGDASQTHKVTIAELDLDAKLDWITIPKMQSNVFLRCKLKNTSEFALLSGPSNVFMDNSFVCKSWIPAASPQESFKTSLGIDPAVRVTYHALQKKAKTTGGFISAKYDVQSFTQRITVKNTRQTSANPLYVKDQVPVSDDADVKVFVVAPEELGVAKERKEVKVGPGVAARWAFKDADDEEEGVEEEGAIEWVCDVGAGKSVDVTLSYDVSVPKGQPWVKR